ncbi:xylulokinase [Amorphus sp. 3PC139-8]|uniref:xylulokinase n=1 Tax=Amorphus sp. 3PC139-8 TaxID=2735676 RepID=UPI00345C924F
MFLGIDLGTSGLKALLVDDDQRVVGHAEAPLTVSRPHPGWSEQDPGAWIAACTVALDDLADRLPAEMSAVRAIGLSGQMHGATLIGGDERPLRPAILWDDVRAHQEAAALDGDPRFRALTGNIVFPGFTAPKLAWLKRHEPETFAQVKRVLLPKDYLRLWLTGEAVSDMSDAAGTAWLDVAGRTWSSALLEATGLTVEQMPRLVEGTEVAGTLRPDLAARWSMGAAMVAGGGGDNAASACGVGVTEPGQGFLSLGTSGVLFAANDRFRPNPESAVHAFCHALPGTWHQMGVILAAGGAMRWLGDVYAADAGRIGAGVDPARVEGPIFLPYLAGERTPHNDAEIRGAFVGLDYGSDRTVLAGAVMEGVAFAFADNLDALSAAGTELDRAIAIGGGSRSDVWLQILADTLGISLDVPVTGEHGAAFGAARLAMAAEVGSLDGVFTVPPIRRAIEPDPDRHQARRERLASYRALYPALKGVAEA